MFLWFDSSRIGNFRPWATRYKKAATWTNCNSFRPSWWRLWNYFWSRKLFYKLHLRCIGFLVVVGIIIKLSKESQKRIMALIGEVNEFHKTRRRGLRRRKRNHYYLQKQMKIDEGKDSKIDSYHIFKFRFLKPSEHVQRTGCYVKSMAISVSDQLGFNW